MQKNAVLFLFIALVFQNCSTDLYSYRKPAISNEKSFEELMVIDAVDKKTRGAAAATLFLNESPEDKNAAILIENNCNCNIIIKISGSQNYLLPIPKMDKNYLVLPKGNYTFQSKLCNSGYISTKNLKESINFVLSEK